MTIASAIVSIGDRVRQAFNYTEDRIAAIVARIVREHGETHRQSVATFSAWEAFNGVQGYVQHDQRRLHNPDGYTRALLALDDQAVTRAYEVALALAV